jgi:hypothetical protein
MARSGRRALLALILAGTTIRLVWAASTAGVGFDITSYRVAADALLAHGRGFYDVVNLNGVVRWPYPPGYLPWTLIAHALGRVIGFRFVVALPAIAADAALAWIVARSLAARGATEGVVLAAVATVAFGPIFALTSGFHGQIDSVAILPAVIAVRLWSRGGGRRALPAGALIGLAALIKGPAGLVLLALLPTARSRQEAQALVAAAAAVIGSALAPFVLTSPHSVLDALNFAGMPGEGGLSLVVQPSLAQLFVGSPLGVHASSATLFLHSHGVVLLAPLLLAVAVVARRRRVEASRTAILLFLTMFVFGAAFSPRYAVWLLPFLLLDGRLRAAIALQLALLGPAMAVYAGPLRSGVLIEAYVLAGIAVWAGLAVWWSRSLIDIVGARAQRLTSSGQPALPASSTARTHSRLPVAGTEIA